MSVCGFRKAFQLEMQYFLLFFEIIEILHGIDLKKHCFANMQDSAEVICFYSVRWWNMSHTLDLPLMNYSFLSGSNFF